MLDNSWSAKRVSPTGTAVADSLRFSGKEYRTERWGFVRNALQK